MKKLILVFAFLFALFSFSQEKSFEITGTLITEDSNTPLESATIYLERVKDSSVVTYTISDKDGKFKLEGSTYDKSLNFYVSYVGYRTYLKKLYLFDNHNNQAHKLKKIGELLRIFQIMKIQIWIRKKWIFRGLVFRLPRDLVRDVVAFY